MKFLYREIGDKIEILRCYGMGGRVELPELIDGKMVVSLGDYLFSEGMRQEPEGILWNEREDGGDKTEDIIAGDMVEEVFLPPALLRMGRYVFYNCDKLKKLHITSGDLDIGAGAFNGCRKISDLYITIISGGRSCLKEILAELNETLTVHYREMKREKDGTLSMAGEASLLFPIYYEEAVENTPAKLLQTYIHGCGHLYRYCFQGTKFEFQEYDGLFIHAKTHERARYVVELSMGRLRYPLELTEHAEHQYREYLIEQIEETAVYLAERNDVALWRWFIERMTGRKIKFEHVTAAGLGNEGMAVRAHEEFHNIEKPILGKIGFGKLIEAASRFGCVDALSYLMDAGSRIYPAEKKKYKI